MKHKISVIRSMATIFLLISIFSLFFAFQNIHAIVVSGLYFFVIMTLIFIVQYGKSGVMIMLKLWAVLFFNLNESKDLLLKAAYLSRLYAIRIGVLLLVVGLAQMVQNTSHWDSMQSALAGLMSPLIVAIIYAEILCRLIIEILNDDRKHWNSGVIVADQGPVSYRGPARFGDGK